MSTPLTGTGYFWKVATVTFDTNTHCTVTPLNIVTTAMSAMNMY
jgi:hypothetical protein